MSMENHGGLMTRKTPDSSARALLGNPTSRAIQLQIRRIRAKGMMEFVY
jgi:hypothetical protein